LKQDSPSRDCSCTVSVQCFNDVFYAIYRFEYTGSVDSPVNDCFDENPQKCTVAGFDCEGHAQAALNKLLTYLSYLIEESITHS